MFVVNMTTVDLLWIATDPIFFRQTEIVLSDYGDAQAGQFIWAHMPECTFSYAVFICFKGETNLKGN